MAHRRIWLPNRTLITATTTPGDKIPASGWQTVTQENSARGSAEIRAIAGTGTTVGIAIETATDPRNPDASILGMFTANATTNGVKDPDSTILTVNLAGKQFFRIIWVIFVTSGTGWASVNGFVDIGDR